MTFCMSITRLVNALILIATFLLASVTLSAQTPVELTLELDQPGATVSPKLYGLMTEEINFSYDGGLYGELIRNRIFKDDAKDAVHWQLVEERGGVGSTSLDTG